MWDISKIVLIFVCLEKLGKAEYNFTDKQQPIRKPCNRLLVTTTCYTLYTQTYSMDYHGLVYTYCLFCCGVEAVCKPHFTEEGTDYAGYFQVKERHKSPGVKFEMHLAIKGLRDGHVKLSPTPFPPNSDTSYVIVIGAGGNSYSELRHFTNGANNAANAKTTTPTILSPSKYMAFFIKVSDDGVTTVGIEGQQPIITYKDSAPIQVNYFSFSAWDGVSLRFLYDCPKPGSIEANAMLPGENDMKLDVIKPNLTITDQLKADLLKDYDPHRRPTTVNNVQTIIFVHFKIKSIKYDVAKSLMTTHGSLTTGWIDPKLSFNKTLYNNISEIILNHKEIWNPELMVHNSLEVNILKSDPNLRVTVDMDGFVLRTESVHLRTWCSPGTRLSHWPHDRHACSINIGLWAQDSSTSLADLHKNITAPVLQEMLDNNSISTEWEIEETIRTIQWSDHFPFTNLTHAEDEREENVFNITVVISRRSESYELLLMTPFLASVVIVLSTFWVPTSQVIKMTILTGNLIYVTLCLTRVLDEMPTYMLRLPNIVRFYLWSIFSIWLSLIVNGILIKLTTEPRPWPSVHNNLKTLLTCTPFSIALGLPSIKRREVGDQVGESDNEDGVYWRVLVIAVERIMFTILLMAYTSMFFVHY